MKLHELKIKHKYLVEVDCGNKTFELRKNDRDYQVGDLSLLKTKIKRLILGMLNQQLTKTHCIKSLTF